MASRHARSNSFPSEPHPLIPQIDEHLCRLKTSEATLSSSICHKLSDLQDLHNCVDELLLLPLTQQAFIQDHHRKWFDQLLDGSLRLLDICSIAKDALLEMKTGIHELQSTMRRRQGGETRLAREVGKYFTTRKVVIKAVQKALKGMETGKRLQSNLSNWSLVSKLVRPKRVASKGEEKNVNELGKVEAALQSLIDHKKSKSNCLMNVESAQNWLGKLESSIQDLEEGIENHFRCLLKTRVSLLNIISR
nr:uncharacterized protein LOC112018376 [Quercus suber]POF18296.1 hypothetical protein CFP56_47541 [Quercus suber]